MCSLLDFSTHSTIVDTIAAGVAVAVAAAGFICFLERASSEEIFSCSLEVRSISPVLERVVAVKKQKKNLCVR